MTLLNFGHPLTPEQRHAIEVALGGPITDERELAGQYDTEQPFGPQAAALADTAGLTPGQWQSVSFIVCPPTLHVMTATLVAEIHGRCGYFPAMVRLRPVPGAVPPRFEFAEIVDLNGVREAARGRR